MSQIENLLTTKREEACEEFDKFLKIGIVNAENRYALSENDIEKIFDSACQKATALFEEDFKILSECEKSFLEYPENKIDLIKNRHLRKIKTLSDYKCAMVVSKLEVDEPAGMKRVLGWISEKDL